MSAALTTNYAGTTCYLYGASSNEYRNVMPNHLMQWTMIGSALARGDRLYDFRGIPCYDQPDSPHYGVIDLKKDLTEAWLPMQANWICAGIRLPKPWWTGSIMGITDCIG